MKTKFVFTLAVLITVVVTPVLATTKQTEIITLRVALYPMCRTGFLYFTTWKKYLNSSIPGLILNWSMMRRCYRIIFPAVCRRHWPMPMRSIRYFCQT